MPHENETNPESRKETISVRVEPEKAVRFRVGTRWKVVGSAVESLWEGRHTITLEEIEAEDD